MAGASNWNLRRVIQLIRNETDADTIIDETGIKRGPLQTMVDMVNRKDHRFYLVRGLFADKEHL